MQLQSLSSGFDKSHRLISDDKLSAVYYFYIYTLISLWCFIQVEPQDLPDTNSVDKQYVYLVAKSDDGHFQFQKEAKILLSYKDGMVFIQTDKPIYTPKQDGTKSM